MPVSQLAWLAQEYDIVEATAETGIMDMAHQGWKTLEDEKELWDTPCVCFRAASPLVGLTNLRWARRNIRVLHLQFNYLEKLPADLGKLVRARRATVAPTDKSFLIRAHRRRTCCASSTARITR